MNTDITFRQTAFRLLMALILCLLIIAPASASTITYSYDTAGQIQGAAYSNGYGITYTYDTSGNRLTSAITMIPDTTPDAFAFTSVSNVALNTLIESNAITITGINTPAAVSITSGEYAISTDNGATWSPYSSSTPSTIAPNSMIKVRQTSAATSITTTIATLFIGGISGTFSVTTADATPPISTILTPENNTGIINTSFTIDGTASDIGSSVSKVEISINSGTWTQATGTISWTYQWTNITPGTYTLQSRATDSAGNIETPKPAITVHVYAATPSIVTITGRSMTLNSQPFTIRGINYSPVPIGEGPSSPPYGDYYTSAYSAIHTRDLTQIRQLGANTIRLWVWDTEADHKDFLDQAYAGGASPLYVIAGYNINAGYDLSNQTTRDMIKEDFRAMVQTHKNHPAILGWAIGNDLNAGALYGASLGNLFSLINEMAVEAHTLDPHHPVMMPLADENLIQTITAYNTSVPSLDIWGANVYRGNSFGNLFSTYQAASSKPLLITGYGIDAYNDATMTENQTAQADHAAALWNEIVANSATTAGGLLTEYSDQWWAGMLSTDSGCPEQNNLILHGDCGNADAAQPDGYDNYEWWGVMRPVDNGTGPDIIEKRAVFTRLQNSWCSPINQPGIIVTAPNGGDNYQVGTTQTIRWNSTGDPGAFVKIELFKGGVFNSTIASSVSTGTLCSGTYDWAIPSSQTIGADYRIRITSLSNSAYTDESNANFAIVPPQVTVLDPWTNLYSGAPNNTGGTITAGSFAVGSGTNRLLLVSVVMKVGTNVIPSISAQYGGTALTPIPMATATNKEVVWMGYLKDTQINSGSKALTITYSGATGNATGLHVKWSSYTGVSQTTPNSGAVHTRSNSATFGSTINYVNNGMTTVVAGNGGTPATGTLTATPAFIAGAATTTNGHTSQTFTTAKHTAAGSYASNTQVSWSGTTGGQSGLVVVSLQPAPVNPVPTTTSLSPSSATAGGAGFTLTVNGTNFVSGSTVLWNGSNRTTTYVSSTQLTAAILAADIASAGTASVTVFNATPGGGTSNAQTFTINAANNPVPTTTSLSPVSAAAGGAGFTLTVNGTNFISGSTVRWNGSNRTTTYVSPTQLTAAILAADITTAGTASVTVFNTTPGGGTSNAQTFTINAAGNPVPATTSLSPLSAIAGGAGFTLTVNGTNFVSGSAVRWNGSNRTTTYVSSTQLTAAILAADIATAGTASVTVFNTTPGGGISNAQTFTINTPASAVAALDPWTNIYSGAPNNTGGTITAGSFTVGSGAQRLLLVSVVMEIGTNANPSISATYGGTALTPITITANSHKEIVWIGRLTDAQIGSGSKALTITYSGATGNATGLHVKWTSYTGVNQTTPIVSYGASNPASNNVTFGSIISYVNNGMTTVVAGNAGTVATATLTATPAFTEGTATATTDGHTSRTFTTAKHTSAGSYASSTAVSWSGTTGGQSGLVVVSLQP